TALRAQADTSRSRTDAPSRAACPEESPPSRVDLMRDDYAGREFPFRIQRGFDRAHLGNRALAVEVFEQFLLERAPADAMLGERAAAEALRFAAELDDRPGAGGDVVIRPGDHVGMHVAVRDVAPDGEVEPATPVAFAVDRHHLGEMLERHDHV